MKRAADSDLRKAQARSSRLWKTNRLRSHRGNRSRLLRPVAKALGQVKIEADLHLRALGIVLGLAACLLGGRLKCSQPANLVKDPSASSLDFRRFSARSIGSPLRTITSGICSPTFQNSLYKNVKLQEGEVAGQMFTSGIAMSAKCRYDCASP